ncbi:MAG: DEAD/DEAH box helicase family protein [Candidatus Nanopelagicaceae bacterium]
MPFNTGDPFNAIESSPSLQGVSFNTEYRSLKDDPAQRFYIPCLQNSDLYRRAVGYFRSTVFIILGSHIIDFVKRGGKIRLICSPDLDRNDIEHITIGYARRQEALANILIEEFDRLLADVETAQGARTLSTLISIGSLEIKIAERADGRGIYHEKLGIFSDKKGNIVSFKGSANETWSGWHDQGNFESIEVFCNWENDSDAKRVSLHVKHFERLWSETDLHISVMPFPATVDAYIKKYAAQGLDELLTEPYIPTVTRRSPLPHQDAAIEAWVANGRRGVFEHATGSGKTFTAIIALKRHLADGQPAMVLVPSRLLLEQWAKEISEEIPEATLLLAGAGHDRWRLPRRIESMTAADPDLGPRIVLSTMQTASMEEFLKRVKQGPHLLVVADEVHQIGSTQNSRFFDINAGARLGLSATPQRYGDVAGTARIFSYFGNVIPPTITLMDAVAAGRLVPYEYYPHAINLSATEADDWKQETLVIRREMSRQKTSIDGERPISERLKLLLIKRARIAKKASAKIQLAVDVIKSNYQDGQSWLVYCEDGGQLLDVLIALRAADLKPVEYHSAMTGNRTATMEWFRHYGGILVSIKCLDEGVDIPSVTHALILASSQNPRQFIQRRGRVLRRSPGKHIAVLHDAIVIPVDLENEPEQIGLLRSELLRSLEFANNAMNKGAGAQLRGIAMSMGLATSSNDGAQIEDDDDDA